MLSPAVLALFALVLATRLVFALGTPRALIAADIVQDDAFYYLTIARNALDGRGLTFDGEGPTNGFHPLQLALVLPSVAAGGDDPWLPVRNTGLASAALALATAPWIYAVARRVAGRGGALAALAIFATSPRLATLGVNGQETGLALLFVFVLVELALRLRPGSAEFGRRDAALFGSTAALAVLARVDLLLLIAAIGIDATLRARVAGRLRAALPSAGFALAIGLLVWGAWGATSLALTGAALPTSGAASHRIALELGWSNLPTVFGPDGARFFDSQNPPFAWYADVAVRALFVYGFEHPLLAPLRLHLPFSVWPALGAYAPASMFAAVFDGSGTLGVFLALVVIGGGATAASIALRRRAGAPSPLGWIVPLYTGLAWLGYTVLSPSHWYFPRYLAPMILLGTLAALGWTLRTVASSRSERARRGWSRGLRLAITCLCAWQLWQLSSFAVRSLFTGPPPERGFLVSWEALSPQLPEGARLGSFQAGIYSWFSGRDVVNLDGKVNTAAARALAAGRCPEYVVASRVEYVIDQPWMVRGLCTRHARPAAEPLLVAVARESRRGGAVLYRVQSGGSER
jgi:hypothetical protein